MINNQRFENMTNMRARPLPHGNIEGIPIHDVRGNGDPIDLHGIHPNKIQESPPRDHHEHDRVDHPQESLEPHPDKPFLTVDFRLLLCKNGEPFLTP